MCVWMCVVIVFVCLCVCFFSNYMYGLFKNVLTQ